MGIDYQQQQINLTLAQENADAKTRLLVYGEALNALEKVVEGLFARLEAAELVSEDDELVTEFRETMAYLRTQGLARKKQKASDPSLTCPGCNAILRNVKGNPGDRCDWCGHEF